MTRWNISAMTLKRQLLSGMGKNAISKLSEHIVRQGKIIHQWKTFKKAAKWTSQHIWPRVRLFIAGGTVEESRSFISSSRLRYHVRENTLARRIEGESLSL
ncbi:hypothetical protein AMECASPLE_006179 [Ameca splendens]|uniref:Uncharacterized protein n=1 Tax=Ameca splendens TaxID=208324 RepID=A0ABV0XCE8_9TELE